MLNEASNEGHGPHCDLDQLAGRFESICTEGNGMSWVLPELAKAICDEAGATAVYGFRFGPDGKQYDLTLLQSRMGALPTTLETWAMTLAARCATTGANQCEFVSGATSDSHARMVAQLLTDRGVGMAGFWFNTTEFDESSHRSALRMARAAMDRATTERRLKESEKLVGQLAAITDLVAKVEATTDLDEGSRVLADEMRRFLGARRVTVGLMRGADKPCQIAAVSDRRRIDDSSEVNRLASAAMSEAVFRPSGSGGATWPPGERDRHALQCHRQYFENQRAEYLESGVLRGSDGDAQGAWLITFDHPPTDTQKRFVEALNRPAAMALQLLAKADTNFFQQAKDSLIEQCQERKGKIAAALAGCLLLAMCVPLKYRVKADCELQPTQRRFVAAPFDGRLEEAAVRPGDTVKQNQIIAQMDGREVEFELNSVNADLHRVTKERAGYLAKHESGQARVAFHEMERLRAKRDLLQHRFDHLEVRSPIDGIVVLGDLDKAEGVPLQVGETLYEIAPLDSMAFEVAIPEDDVRYVETGMPVKLRLDAFPFRSWRGKVERIHPRAELKDHENVFVAELFIENADGNLRPGMRGSAKVSTRWRPFGWILFHKPLAAVLGWLGW